jgi:hypothetical protein
MMSDRKKSQTFDSAELTKEIIKLEERKALLSYNEQLQRKCLIVRLRESENQTCQHLACARAQESQESQLGYLDQNRDDVSQRQTTIRILS